MLYTDWCHCSTISCSYLAKNHHCLQGQKGGRLAKGYSCQQSLVAERRKTGHLEGDQKKQSEEGRPVACSLYSLREEQATGYHRQHYHCCQAAGQREEGAAVAGRQCGAV
jgi:hypothetical protein